MKYKKQRGQKRKLTALIRNIYQIKPFQDTNCQYEHFHVPCSQFISSPKTYGRIKTQFCKAWLDKTAEIMEQKPDCLSFCKVVAVIDEFDLWESQIIIFYDKKYNSEIAQKIPQMENASLIFDAQKILFLLRNNNFTYTQEDLAKISEARANTKYIEIFKNADKTGKITKLLKTCTYKETLTLWNNTFKYTQEETTSLLKMLVYVMDFKSTQTVRHTINTASYAATIGELMGCSQKQIDKLYTAALLHDLGKMAIPESILESPTNLSNVEFILMKTHVGYTIKLLQNSVPEDIFKIAAHHHEKLDGTGYPFGLTAEQLSIEERILTVADIVSALIDNRTYKAEYSKEKVIEICQEMVQDGQLDSSIVKVVENNFDKLKEDAASRNKFMSVPLGLVEMLFHEEMDYESL
jgi:putative nucleotidyltransferase with HDIG domain